MNIGIIDAEIMGKSKHRFPNLACMKLSGYYKELKNNVELLLSYDDLEKYDKVFISKVFIKTEGKDITLPNLIGWSKKEVQTYASVIFCL